MKAEIEGINQKLCPTMAINCIKTYVMLNICISYCLHKIKQSELLLDQALC